MQLKFSLLSVLITLLAACVTPLKPDANGCSASAKIQYRQVYEVSTDRATNRAAILEALRKDNRNVDWYLERTRGDWIFAGMLSRATYYLQVAIWYDDNQVITYLCTSRNLGEKSWTIHRNAEGWKAVLDAAIQRSIVSDNLRHDA